MLTRRLFLALGAAVLTGCAAVSAPNPPAGGPADPNAAETPPPARSQTLAVSEGAEPALPSAGQSADMKPEMGSAGDMRGMPGMSHGMHSTGEDMSGMRRPAHPVAPTQPGEAASLSAPRWTPATVPATAPADGSHEHRHEGGTP